MKAQQIDGQLHQIIAGDNDQDVKENQQHQDAGYT
jgi:hypothetical protein